MKAIQVTMDEELLRQLDEDQETETIGRSAVIRKATADYLRRKKRRTIAEQYRRAYGEATATDELRDWADEGVWPNE